MEKWRGSGRPSGPWRGEEGYGEWGGPREYRDEREWRSARDTMEGGDLGWHGGVRGSEGGGGYGGGFFGTAYGLYSGRPERIGRGPKGYRRSDDAIHDEVCERIARSGVNGEDVEVKVANGEVTLTGTVERREDRWRLETLCDSIFGVEDVHDELRMSDPRPRRSDIIPTH